MNTATTETLSATRPELRLNGAELLLDTLLACGVDTIFGYPGGAALPLYDALYQRPALRHVLVRHEQAAVHAAEGYARSTGRVGVVLVRASNGVVARPSTWPRPITTSSPSWATARKALA